MRDYRDAKAMAQTIRAALAAKGPKITIGESLELIAKAFGFGDWNTLAATIKAAPKDAADPPAPSPEPPSPSPPLVADPPPRRTGQRFSPNLEATLHRSVAFADARRHQYTTLEHLLLALADDADAAEVMEACQVDLSALRSGLTHYIDEDLKGLVMPQPAEQAGPTAGFHRVIQRAVIHVQSSGREAVTGANVLVAIFSEQESRAYHLLAEQGMTRFDAVNFIALGNRKGGAAG
jgi:hypothetical protein